MPEANQQHINRPAGSEPDPLGKLYHMSTTAGVGSHDYVAVNVVSVVTVLLGLASSLALLAPILLGIPILALIFAIIALRQISHSGGTQTGRMLAWVGIALAIMFAAMEGTRIAAEQKQDAADQANINTLLASLTSDVRSGNLDDAYQLFSPDFRNRVNLDAFKREMNLVHENPIYGQLSSFESNGHVIFAGGYNEDVRQAIMGAQMKFTKQPQGVTQDVQFRRRDGTWYIDDLPALFPPSAPGK